MRSCDRSGTHENHARSPTAAVTKRFPLSICSATKTHNFCPFIRPVDFSPSHRWRGNALPRRVKQKRQYERDHANGCRPRTSPPRSLRLERRDQGEVELFAALRHGGTESSDVSYRRGTILTGEWFTYRQAAA